MTEKRFRLGYVCGDFGLIDNDKWIDLHSMSENSEKNVQICINKMNDLADENEQLKSENIDLRKDLGEFEKSINIQGLIGENEQLKARLNDLNDENEWLKLEIQKLYNFVKIDVEHNIEVYPKSLMEHILEILKIIGDKE